MGEIISEKPLEEKIVFVDESVKGKYTTADLIASDVSVEKVESKKIVLSNDALAVCQLLETFINKFGGRF
jgi:RNase H-fold protein (predicted Holliday junction resolvase)